MQNVSILPIAVPSITVDELKDITDNFGTKALIGEGSYGRVYHGVMKSGRAAAIKKLDSSKQPDREFSAQVRSIGLSYFDCPILYINLLPCLDTCNCFRFPWYQD